MSRSANQAPTLTIVDPPEEGREHKGVFGKVKGFFSGLFKK
jgi:hypothetical protein